MTSEGCTGVGDSAGGSCLTGERVPAPAPTSVAHSRTMAMMVGRVTGPSGGPGALLLGAMMGAMIAGRLETALLCLGVAAGTAAAAGARTPSGSWLGAVAGGGSVALLLNLYLTPGQPLPGPRILGAVPSLEGLRFGTLLALRLLGAATAIHGLRAAWPGERAADELARRLAPLERLHVPVREARVILGLALRFVPLLVLESRRIAGLQELRAGRPSRGLREWFQRRRAAVIPTLVAALERAEQTALALEARHYRVRPLPTHRGGKGWTGAGWLVAGTALLWRG